MKIFTAQVHVKRHWCLEDGWINEGDYEYVIWAGSLDIALRKVRRQIKRDPTEFPRFYTSIQSVAVSDLNMIA